MSFYLFYSFYFYLSYCSISIANSDSDASDSDCHAALVKLQPTRFSYLPLPQVSARKLKPQAQPPPTLHERILEEIKAERKLRPVSPGEIRRGRLGKSCCCCSLLLTQVHILVHVKTYFALSCLLHAEVWSSNTCSCAEVLHESDPRVQAQF